MFNNIYDVLRYKSVTIMILSK